MVFDQRTYFLQQGIIRDGLRREEIRDTIKASMSVEAACNALIRYTIKE